MAPNTHLDLHNDVHLLLDQLRMPFANADPGGADDRGTIGQLYERRRMCVR